MWCKRHMQEARLRLISPASAKTSTSGQIYCDFLFFTQYFAISFAMHLMYTLDANGKRLYSESLISLYQECSILTALQLCKKFKPAKSQSQRIQLDSLRMISQPPIPQSLNMQAMILNYSRYSRHRVTLKVHTQRWGSERLG